MSKSFNTSEHPHFSMQDILACFAKANGLSSDSLENYSNDQLVSLVNCLLGFIQSLLTKLAKDSKERCNSVLTMDVIQEWIDEFFFRLKRDSTSSSSPPSKDPAFKADNGQNKANTSSKDESHDSSDSNSTSKSQDGCKSPSNPQLSDSKDSSSSNNTNEGVETSTFEEEEKQAEGNLRRDHNRSRRRSSGKKPGKQPGAKGFGFAIPDTIEEENIIVRMPEKCNGCPHYDECKNNAKLGAPRKEYDIKVIRVCNTYYEATVDCLWDNNTTDSKIDDCTENTGKFPDGISGNFQYGKTIKTLVCLLYCVGMVSLGRIQKIIAPMTGYKISPATMTKFINELADKTKPIVERILEKLKDEPVVHCDETSGKINSQLYWIHCIATQLCTFISIQEKRGKEGMDAIGFLAEYLGTVVHDCLAAYWGYINCIHAICNGHIERELEGLSKFFKNANQWADDMLKLLQTMLHDRHQAEGYNLKSLPKCVIAVHEKAFDELIERGKMIHPIPERQPGQKGRVKRGRARALIDRMEKRKEEIFRFAKDFNVPFTNNEAERSFRLVSTRRNVGFFRTLEGAKNFCTIWSYVSTAFKQGFTYFEAIDAAFKGNGMSLLFPDEEVSEILQTGVINIEQKFMAA